MENRKSIQQSLGVYRLGYDTPVIGTIDLMILKPPDSGNFWPQQIQPLPDLIPSATVRW